LQLLRQFFGDRARATGEQAHVFTSIYRGLLVEDPFPHLVIEDALPARLIDTLLGEMPPAEVFTRDAPPGRNVRFALASPIALADPRPSAAWKAALSECTAGMDVLLAATLRRLGNHLMRTYPDSRRALRRSQRCAPCRGPGRTGNCTKSAWTPRW